VSRRSTLDRILDTGVLPIVRTDTAAVALDAARAIRRAGLAALEITMTVPGALSAIEKLAEELGDEVAVGAGSVLDAETARACILAGAEFFVTPCLSIPTIELCRRYGKVVIPGALTPTEVLTAWEAGADLVKVFPCGNMGGPSYIQALKAPLPQVLLVPTGGVRLDNTADFFKAGATAVAVGSEICDKAALAAGRFELIEERARQFVETSRVARGRPPSARSV
jgi:2-dehydro-3-deoxyphosphogluconate aldolase/(4S)-4-hydroxy-2-oxoglutarate aldolase